jgi:metal iron transporter
MALLSPISDPERAPSPKRNSVEISESEKKNIKFSEKDGAAVLEVVESAQSAAPPKSARERITNLTHSLFTKSTLTTTTAILWKLARFSGPGAIISVAYVDPDNLQTNLTSGAEFQYKLLFMILFSNIVAVFLQALSTKLGCVTGMDLAQMNRAFLPRWLNIGLWLMAEASIVCTDISQVCHPPPRCSAFTFIC